MKQTLTAFLATLAVAASATGTQAAADATPYIKANCTVKSAQLARIVGKEQKARTSETQFTVTCTTMNSPEANATSGSPLGKSDGTNSTAADVAITANAERSIGVTRYEYTRDVASRTKYPSEDEDLICDSGSDLAQIVVCREVSVGFTTPWREAAIVAGTLKARETASLLPAIGEGCMNVRGDVAWRLVDSKTGTCTTSTYITTFMTEDGINGRFVSVRTH